MERNGEDEEREEGGWKGRKDELRRGKGGEEKGERREGARKTEKRKTNDEEGARERAGCRQETRNGEDGGSVAGAGERGEAGFGGKRKV